MPVDQFAFNLYCGMNDNCFNDVAYSSLHDSNASDCRTPSVTIVEAASRRVPAGLQFAECCPTGRLPKGNNTRAALTAAAGYLSSWLRGIIRLTTS